MELGTYDLILDKPWHEEFIQQVNYCNNICYVKQKGRKYTFIGIQKNKKNIQQIHVIEVEHLEKELDKVEAIILMMIQDISAEKVSTSPPENTAL